MSSEEEIFENRIDKINKINQLYEELVDKPSQNEGYDIIQSLLISTMSFCLAMQPTKEESYDEYLKPEYSGQAEEQRKNYTFKFKKYKVVLNLIPTLGDGYCIINALLGIRAEDHSTREIKKNSITKFVKKNKELKLKDDRINFFYREVLDLYCLEKGISYILINKISNEIDYFLNPNTINFSLLRIIYHNGGNHYEQIDWDIFSGSKETIINKKTKKTDFDGYSKTKNDYILNILQRYNYAILEKKQYIYRPFPYENEPVARKLNFDDQKSKNIENKIKNEIKDQSINIYEYFYRYSNFGRNHDMIENIFKG